MSSESFDWFESAVAQGAHVHIDWEGRDCDGRYQRTSTVIPGDYGDTDERTTVRGLWKEVIGDNLPWNGRITIEDRGEYVTAEIDEPTEEGYSHYSLALCFRADADMKPTFRDLTAEAAGY